MKETSHHIVPRDGRWVIRKINSKRAIKEGCEIAKNQRSDLFISSGLFQN